jgi:hypothetical protein
MELQLTLYNCAKINNKNNAPFITITDEMAIKLKPTLNTICRESCFTINQCLLPLWLKQQLENTSGVFTIKENIEFLKLCEIDNNTKLKTGFSEFLSLSSFAK